MIRDSNRCYARFRSDELNSHTQIIIGKLRASSNFVYFLRQVVDIPGAKTILSVLRMREFESLMEYSDWSAHAALSGKLGCEAVFVKWRRCNDRRRKPPRISRDFGLSKVCLARGSLPGVPKVIVCST